MESLTPPPDQNINSSRAKIFALFFIIVLFLAIGAGVFLVSQRTNLVPKAAAPIQSQVAGKTSLNLIQENSESLDDTASVLVKFNSSKDNANLIVVKIKFPQELVSVASVVTDSTFLEASNSASLIWIDTSFDNLNGNLNLIVAIPQPGVKTEASKDETLAKIYFKGKKSGGAELTFDSQTAVYRNSDNVNILTEKPTFLLSISEGIASNFKPECLERPLCLDEKPACKVPEPEGGYCKIDKNEASLDLTSPVGGEVFNFNSEIPIKWSASNLEGLSISLLMNDALFGKLVEVRADYGSFSWNPIQSLPLAYLNDQNTFKIEISSIDKSGKVNKDKSTGPFVITTRSDFSGILTNSTSLSESSVDFDGNGIALEDISLLMSNFFLPPVDKKFDLNKDGNINGLDLYFMQNILKQKGII